MERLGQHFLKNPAVLKKIANALDAQSGETIIEIGAGHGELTEKIKNQISNIKIIAIEKDPSLIPVLRNKFSEAKSVEIIEGDVLKLLPELCSMFHVSGFKIVGNIPYYLTGYLLRILGELERKPRRSVFTIQKEVALRIVAAPPKMNKLAASVQFWAEPNIVGFVPKSDFHPAPKVDSAIVRLETGNREQGTNDAENYYRAVQALFRQPRKTILNNLLDTEKQSENYIRGSAKEKIVKKLARLGINPENRPQDLSVENIIAIASIFS